MPTEPTGPTDTFVARLNHLFETVHPPHRGAYSNQEVAELLRERGGETISHVYLWKLRTGRATNPSRRQLETLAAFFGVPVGYFFDDATAARVDAELEVVQHLRDSGVQRVATRVAGLSPQSLEQVLAAIEEIRHREGLETESGGDATEGHP
ncbi:helix-turn-helix domain-containing protein [Streptomyces megasporus]|uniref:helix-turn-helix domain-containing protein n=1 Tax=Streptomyces megasporus TaxID=44060 RepID=UPI0004E0B6B4|nr:helix-turn-helix domain-containing protein [Streptomyces megasporus]